jgi:hypothetical protein
MAHLTHLAMAATGRPDLTFSPYPPTRYDGSQGGSKWLPLAVMHLG